MGEVYRARDSRLGRDVAIKVPPDRFARDPAALARFEREARAIAALSHPNILDIHDIGREGDVYFTVTELLAGETLRERLATSAVPWRMATEIGLAVAEGLAAAHSKGVVHRDLKPDNIFLTTDGRVKILDFGLARVETIEPVSASSPTLAPPTRTGEVLGTVGYMAPEQVRGAHADARSDIFSLGCVLYEMTTGRRAFARETPPETLVAILREEPADPKDVSDVPDELRLIILHCLQKNPHARFESAKDLAFALRMASLEPGRRATPRPEPRRRIRSGFVAAAGLATAALVSVLLLRTARPGPSPVSTPAGAASLAVLPFGNPGGDPSMEYLSDGITESLINRLSEIRDVSVIARTTVFQFKGSDPRDAGRRLGVGSIVTGQVRRTGEDLLVQVDLVDVGTGSQRWGGKFQKALTGLGALQETIAQEISQALKTRLGGNSEKRSTTDAAAYDAYLRGRYYWNKRTEEGAEKSVGYFQEALRRDPAFALGWAGLADAYDVLAFYGWRSPREVLPKSRGALLRAIEIDPTLAEAHASLADVRYQYDWEWEAAESGFRNAIRLNPNYATAHQWYSNFLSLLGRSEEAEKEIREAQRLDPLNLVIDTDAALTPYWAGRDREALAELRRVLELEPEFPLAHFYLGLVSLRSRPEDAMREARTASSLAPGDPDAIALYGHASAVAARREDAERALQELFALSRKRFVSAFPVAFVYVGLGENDKAIQWLEKAFEERAGRLVYLRVERAFDPLRSDPRFQRLVERLRFPS
jgi:serine/threonine-protein kinase